MVIGIIRLHFLYGKIHLFVLGAIYGRFYGATGFTFVERETVIQYRNHKHQLDAEKNPIRLPFGDYLMCIQRGQKANI